MAELVRENQYWLLGWLESHHIGNISEVAALLDKPSEMDDIRKAAEDWTNSKRIEVPSGLNLAAGTGLRLDDILTCPNPACRRLQIDILFRHAWHYFYAHFSDPLLRIGTSFTPRPDSTQESVIAAGAHYVMHVHKDHLEEDLRTRYLLKAPLGASVWSHERVLSAMGAGGPAEILFELSLPSLAHVPIGDLIAIRQGEGDSFEAFRRALTKAAKELIKQGPITNPRDAAAEIVRDSIEPELARLNQKLRGAERALARRSAVSVTLSTLTTACGLVFGLDPVAVGVAAMGLLGATGYDAISKYAEEEATIEMSDMYFLWKTLGHAE